MDLGASGHFRCFEPCTKPCVQRGGTRAHAQGAWARTAGTTCMTQACTPLVLHSWHCAGTSKCSTDVQALSPFTAGCLLAGDAAVRRFVRIAAGQIGRKGWEEHTGAIASATWPRPGAPTRSNPNYPHAPHAFRSTRPRRQPPRLEVHFLRRPKLGPASRLGVAGLMGPRNICWCCPGQPSTLFSGGVVLAHCGERRLGGCAWGQSRYCAPHRSAQDRPLQVCFR